MKYSFEDLVKIMATLRSPGGCPWDRQQTHQSLLPYLVEESHEYIDAAQADDKAHMAEELGDVLFQVVFHSQVANENGDFSIDDVVQGICEKMIRRHPHVFGDAKSMVRMAWFANGNALRRKKRIIYQWRASLLWTK